LDFAGRTLVGKYRIEKMLGQGGMGSVWRGTHSITGRKIAVKILDEKFLSNANVVQRFGREARAASSIAHEGIVEVLDLDQTEEGIPFLVMEFLEGESLAHRIDYGARMTEEQVLSLGTQLLDALHAAHESGVVHRDLKPDNIYVIPGARGERIKILDFGISWKDDEQDAKLTVTGSVLGTPHYMSPEQAMGDTDTDRRVDIYAAGVVLYECVVGSVPFEGANYNKLLRIILDNEPTPPSKRGAKISPAVEAVILKALSKRKEDRPSTAAEMRQMILRASRGEEPAPSSKPGLLATKSALMELSDPGAGLGLPSPQRTEDSVAARWLGADLEQDPPAPKSRPEAAALPPKSRPEIALPRIDNAATTRPSAARR
jgi:serine/threonine protein kinase